MPRSQRNFSGPHETRTQAEVETRDTGLSLVGAEISTKGVKAVESVEFTWRNAPTGVWRGCNYDFVIAS